MFIMCDNNEILTQIEKIDSSKKQEETTDSQNFNEFLTKNINRDISVINNKINDMYLKKLQNKFKWFHYPVNDIHNYKKQLKLELAKLIKKNQSSLYENKSVFPYYVVVDFEATCEMHNPENYTHEIIEFPAVLIDSHTLQIIDIFQKFCRPTIKLKLSEFCMELTGITQEDVDKADTFNEVLKSFEQWLRSHRLNQHNFTIVCDGPWDMTRFLFVQCILSNIEYPKWAEKWVDIRRIFKKFYEQKRTSLKVMLEFLKMGFDGRPHCGRDDAVNISRVVRQMICDGACLQPNQTISPASKKEKNRIKERVDLDNELFAQISDLSFEAEKFAIQSNGKIVNHRDIKIERTRKIHCLGKLVNSNELEELNAQLENLDLSPIRKRKKSNKKRN